MSHSFYEEILLLTSVISYILIAVIVVAAVLSYPQRICICKRKESCHFLRDFLDIKASKLLRATRPAGISTKKLHDSGIIPLWMLQTMRTGHMSSYGDGKLYVLMTEFAFA